MTNFFAEIEGDSQYTGTQFDMSLKEEWTKTIFDCIEKLLLNGYSRSCIASALSNEKNFKMNNARTLVDKVNAKMYKKGADRKKMMMAKNIIRLEHIYDVSMQSGNIANALKTIDLLNKLCNLYENQLEIKQTSFTFQLGENNQQQELPEHIEITPIEIIEENENVDVE